MSLYSEADNGQTYSISDFSVASDTEEGVSFEGRFVQISESLCSGLEDGEEKSILVTYKLIGKYGSEIPQTAIFRLALAEGGPIISSDFEHDAIMHNGAVYFDLVPYSVD